MIVEHVYMLCAGLGCNNIGHAMSVICAACVAHDVIVGQSVGE